MTISMKLLALTAMLASCASLAGDEYPEVTEEGLHKVKDSQLGLVYAKQDADFSVYDRIWLVEPAVAFKKNWQREQNRSQPFKVNKNDMQRIRDGLAEMFTEVFTAELTEGGYTLVEEADEDVLIVRPAIINLDVRAPDTSSAGRSYQYAESAGEMTLYVELYDSVTGDLVAKALDRRRDRESGYFDWHTRITNRDAADKILKSWAKTLRQGLDEAHGLRRGD